MRESGSRQGVLVWREHAGVDATRGKRLSGRARLIAASPKTLGEATRHFTGSAISAYDIEIIS
jgi:hypothetical protein